jgi:transcriptional regulator with XRE-family HTH domain
MENIKEIIAKNLVELRKSHKLTQQALAEKLNYTDKAISRWEHAETLPDIETLCRVCDIYGVKFEYLLQKEQPEDKAKNPNIKRKNTGSKVVITLISACTVWLIVTVLYAAMWTATPWTLFIWALPSTAAILAICNQMFFGSKIFRILSSSFFTWTLLLSLYIELLVRHNDNIWIMFIIGVPLQAIIILIENIKLSRTRKED